MSCQSSQTTNELLFHEPLDHQQQYLMDGFANPGHEAINQVNYHEPLQTAVDNDHEELPMMDVDAIIEELMRTNESGLAPNLPSLGKDDTHKGQAAQVQKFYPGRPKCKCCVNWVEKRPQQVPEEAQEKYQGVAVQIYHKQDHTKETIGNLQVITPSWVVFQSPIILRVLGPLFKKTSGTEAVQGKLTLYPPFQDLFFAYSDIIEAHEKCEKDSEEESHIEVLRKATDELILETASDFMDLQARGLMTWKNLWTLYKKGTIVVSNSGGHELLYEILEYSVTSATAKCRNIGFDGTNYGFMTKQFQQREYHGAKAIRELEIYPIWFYENRLNLERKILQCSNRVLGHQGMLHAEYDQRLSIEGKEYQDGTEPSSIRSRIIVDPYAYDRFGPGLTVTRLTSDDPIADEQLRQHFENFRTCRPSEHRIRKNKDLVLSWPPWLLLLDPFIAGYSLKSHRFMKFHVNYINSVVKWNDWAFERIVFAEESKDLLLTLVKGHKDMKFVGQDIIPGKGNGLVVLLSGPPGTGKTLTAEALADKARRPLFRIQAETLGSLEDFEGELEVRLEEAFRLAAEWNALLLIDEADAFLGSSDQHGKLIHSSRSSLVRTLMTSLEYYSGLLFLTTNFPNHIDEAFASRIDIHFEYPVLDRHARSKLIRNTIDFIQSSDAFTQTVDLTDEEIWDLARWKLNGRELKNAAKISSRLCSIKKENLSVHHMKLAIRHTSPSKYKEPEEDDANEPPSKRARIC